MFGPPLLHYGRVPWPAPWREIFGRAAPLLLDLGFGGGDSLVDLARRHSEANVLGLEISLPALRKGRRKTHRAGLRNVRVMQGESRSALWLLFRPGTVAGVTINFPDPWPKAAHHHRRLISGEFLHLLATRMMAGAPLDIATDHAEYSAGIAEALAQTPTFASRLDAPYVTVDEERVRTKYEQIALAEGRTCRYFKWQRNDASAPDLFPIPEETPVPHVVLLSTRSLDEISRSFAPFELQVGDLRVRYQDVYRSLQHDLLLVETYVSEDPFHQRIGLAVRQRRAGDLVVSLHEIGFPRPTPGLHEAVHGFVNWLRAADPGLTVLGDTLARDAVDEAPE